MAYRKTSKYSQQLANMRAAKEAKRLAGSAPEYPPELPNLRREIIIIDHDFGRSEHRFALYRTRRVDCYRVEVDGRPWAARMGWQPETDGRGWMCEVWQSAYGHRANKATWLYYCGTNPPFELRWERPKGTHQIGFHDQRGKAANKPTLGKREANATPLEFRDVLLRLAMMAHNARVQAGTTAPQPDPERDEAARRGASPGTTC